MVRPTTNHIIPCLFRFHPVHSNNQIPAPISGLRLNPTADSIIGSAYKILRTRVALFQSRWT